MTGSPVWGNETELEMQPLDGRWLTTIAAFLSQECLFLWFEKFSLSFQTRDWNTMFGLYWNANVEWNSPILIPEMSLSGMVRNKEVHWICNATFTRRVHRLERSNVNCRITSVVLIPFYFLNHELTIHIWNAIPSSITWANRINFQVQTTSTYWTPRVSHCMRSIFDSKTRDIFRTTPIFWGKFPKLYKIMWFMSTL